CAVLMSIYAFSPIVALVINLILFAICAVVFVWVRRREIFFRTLLVDWVLSWWSKSDTSVPDRLIVFPKQGIGGIPARGKCELEKLDSGWQLTHRRFLLGDEVESIEEPMVLEPGWWTGTFVMKDGKKLTFSIKFQNQYEELARVYGVGFSKTDEASLESADRQFEFA
ncbi:MAG: hypothetical protein AAGA30_04410, partial [Planctomycetota bacterium]